MSGQSHWKPPDRAVSPLPTMMSANPADIPVTRARSGTTTRVGNRASFVQTLDELPTSLQKLSVHPTQASRQQIQVIDIKNTCEDCESQKHPIWNCAYCGMNFCDDCWERQAPHRKGRVGADGLPHEKADPTIVKRLKNILTPPTDVGEQQLLHVEDEDTTWFGIVRDEYKRPMFHDYGRYASIMADSNLGDYKLRYPRLISFIGETGAGKSTLVKMLIDQQERQASRPQMGHFPSPVVGSIRNENVPTSGDVHLYGDPKTYYEEYPVLYADCEGLEGGENMPMSVQYCNISMAPKEKEKHNTQHERRRLQKLPKVARGTQRNIEWADSPEKSKRQYAVSELYPRLLYTFSDVIVFVLRNPKTFESSVLSKLINWATASMEKSVNQPTLPHAVIALNATDMGVDQQEWDPEFATNILMSSVAGAIHRDPYYRNLAYDWSHRGKRIHTMNDLLECYYSSVTVVRVPVKGRYMKIDEQINKMHHILSKRCVESFNAKRRSRMLSNSEELNIYLQCAFDHFSNNLDTPFNFMDIAFKINPIPSDFGGNILKLAVAIKESPRYIDPRNMFRELSFMVASCILLDCARQSLKGPAEQILDKAYLDYCDAALEEFCAIFWPCSFSNKRGRCVNVRERHKKGHQNERGQVIGTGDYESDFTWESFSEEWVHLLQEHLSNFQQKVVQKINYNSSTTELQATSSLHHSNVNAFYQRLGGAHRFVSHSTCFCCLREMAEHPLPCGHVICTPCVRGYGKPNHRPMGVYALTVCPLHEVESKFPSPREVFFKPPLAGVRVLSLDGGGIRGIVILEVLRGIQKELGDRIPIQDFFDLIVGTSTGGILALSLGVGNWPVEDSIGLFKRLVDTAFTPKFGGLKFGKRKYRTRPLEGVLMDHFKDESIFGGGNETSASYLRKVAVTASNETGEQAVIFSNYNRVADGQINYRLERPDKPENELKLWEAARATSAAPTFFRPFVNSRTKEGFIDGAVFHNNPVRIANYESKLLWPDVEDRHPDILLSIGTGHNGSDTEGYVDPNQSDQRRLHNRGVLTKQKTEEPQRSNVAFWAFPEVNSWLNVLFKRVDNLLDSEAMWKSFYQDVGRSSYMNKQQYIRVNPRVKFRTPKMDDKSQVDKLHEDVISRLQTPSMRERITRIAYRLVASSFFFERSSPPRESDDHVTVQGTICCRFAKGSSNLRNLGFYMQRHQFHSFQPYFRVQEANHMEKAQNIMISNQVIKGMIDYGSFDVGSIVIPVSERSGIISIALFLTNDRNRPQPFNGLPISGFPRSLGEEIPLKRAASPAASEQERTSIAKKLESLRRKRSVRPHYSDEKSLSTYSGSNSDDIDCPRNAQDVGDWVARRLEGRRPPLRPVQDLPPQDVFELHGSDVPPGYFDEDDEDDEALAKALERSVQEATLGAGLRRTMSGTDEDELERAIKLSMVEQ